MRGAMKTDLVSPSQAWIVLALPPLAPLVQLNKISKRMCVFVNNFQ